MILVDPPRWPAHGTTFGHLVSDESLDELHAFAAAAGLPSRAFDHDHYDVPVERYAGLVAAGAHPVEERELVRRLIASGLRVRRQDKTPTRAAAAALATRAWDGLGLPPGLRDDLLARWSEPHRHYHDVRHLAQCLHALGELSSSGDPSWDGGGTMGGAGRLSVVLAVWFHDAVYEGVPGDDEEASARLAERWLRGVLPSDGVREVARLVRMTAEHRPVDEPGALLSDADLSILGQSRGRYHVYARDVRLDYAHVPDDGWREGRGRALDGLLAADPLFHTPRGRALWEARARLNLAEERARL